MSVAGRDGTDGVDKLAKDALILYYYYYYHIFNSGSSQ